MDQGEIGVKREEGEERERESGEGRRGGDKELEEESNKA